MRLKAIGQLGGLSCHVLSRFENFTCGGVGAGYLLIMKRGRLVETECKQRFSIAYVETLAALAGLAVEIRSIDYFGVDLEILNGPFRIDVQMKGMNEAVGSVDAISYDLGVHAYNELADPERSIPAYLFVVEMPPLWDDWAHLNDSALILHKSAYYAKVSGLPQTGNKSTKVVHLPRINKVTPEFLFEAVEKSRKGEI